MQPSIHQYRNHSVHQLLTVSYFLAWVRFPDAENTAFWEAFTEVYPDKRQDVSKAAAIARSMYVIDEKPAYSVWEGIHQEISRKPAVRNLGVIWKAAAILIIAVIATWMIFRTQPDNNIQIASRFGEVKHIILPDSSEVTLNGNSSVRYNKDWNKREIWIEGEAFFNIKSQDTKGFEVHSTGLDVNVLGTSFNVRNRRGVTAVVLNSGKVIVAAEDNKQLVLSKPGDMALYDKNENDLSKKQVPVDNYTSWQEQKLRLDQKTVESFFEMLEDDWGYTIQLNDTSLLNKKISGEIDMKDKHVLVDALAVILHANVTYQGSTIIVTPN